MKEKIDVDKLITLHSQGLYNTQIARELDTYPGKVRYWLQKLNLKSNLARGLPPEAVDAEHSKCSKCSKIVRNENFPWVNGKRDGRRLSYCMQCRYEQVKASTVAKPSTFFKDKCTRIEYRARKDGIDFDLTPEFLIEVWQSQGGKCFYTDAKLELKYDTRSKSVSFDRINPLKGYTQDNIVICQARINTMKSDATLDELREWMPGWYARLVETGKVER